MFTLTYITLAFTLVFLNGMFVAAEFSLVQIRPTQLEGLKNKYGFRGKIVKIIHQQLDAYLSACQLGITLTSLGLGWVGEPAFSHLLEPLYYITGFSSDAWQKALNLITGFTIISFLHIVIGELVPKSIAIRRTHFIALWTAIPLYCFHWLFYPAIWFLNNCALMLLSVLGLQKFDKSFSRYSSDELKLIISASHTHGELEYEELAILENTLEFADLKAADLMRPIDEMITITISDDTQTMLNTITQNHYSRYPVFDAQHQNIIGLLHVKDLFAALHKNQSINVLKLMRPILLINPDIPVVDLFKHFRAGFAHFAIIKTDYNDIIGFLTLDHILGALLGNIHDEFNDIKKSWIALHNGSFLMKGNTPIYALEKALNIELSNVKAHTISGLITEKLERLPEPKEHIHFEKFSIIIRKMKGHHILLVKILPHIS